MKKYDQNWLNSLQSLRDSNVVRGNSIGISPAEAKLRAMFSPEFSKAYDVLRFGDFSGKTGRLYNQSFRAIKKAEPNWSVDKCLGIVADRYS